MAKPGARNTITDVPGIKVGQAEDASVRTGVSVIVPDAPGWGTDLNIEALERWPSKGKIPVI